ncbi:uncharacterized protein V1518DRAFT_369543 [Limtongia smithiae]|uniref:uncharacterized protein n=1 Tax=Limtongia smithiae TaxID=1125753 RepID=UPI0034CF3F5E
METRSDDATTLKPLEGLIFCSTGVAVETRNDIERKVKSLGGTFCLDLMSAVTHLVVRDTNQRPSEKYCYALFRRPDLVFVEDGFIPKLHERWKSGKDIDVAEEMRSYGEYLFFTGYRIGLSKSIDKEKRHKYAQFIRVNGGIVMENMSEDMTIFVGSEAIGRRYDYCVAHNIKVVHFTWLDACIKRHAFISNIFDFSFELDEKQRQINLDKIPRKINKDISTSRLNSATAKTDSVLTMRPANRVQRKKSENTWNSIMSEVENPSTSSLAKADSLTGANGDTNFPFEIITSEDAGLEKSAEHLFEGHVFKFYGFEDANLQKIEDYLTSRGGVMLSKTSIQSPTHVVVSNTTKPEFLPAIPSTAVLITDWYIDLALYHNELPIAAASPYSKYLGYDIYSEESEMFADKVVCITGFTGTTRNHIKKLISLLGGEIDEDLTTSCDLLVFPMMLYPKLRNGTPITSIQEFRSSKIQYARQWNIPVVPDEWLLSKDCYRKIKELFRRTKRKSETAVGAAPQRRRVVR